MKPTKARTVRAWAVVCGDGQIRAPIENTKAGALSWFGQADDCGPHTVIPLTGTFTPQSKKGARNGR